METIEVRPGQVWADNDPRSEGRTLRVDAVEADPQRARRGHPALVAVCTILTNSDTAQRQVDRQDPWTSDRRGKVVRIRVDRMLPTSTGYRLVSEPEEAQR
jgi:hypothetical protein